MKMKTLQSLILSIFIGALSLSAFAAENKNLTELLENNRNLEGDFQQVTYSDTGVKQQESEGSFTLAQPNRFVWETIKPFPQHIISDGDVITIWDIDLEQATQKPFEKALGNSPAALLSQPATKVLPYYAITQIDNNNFELIPIDNDGLFSSLTLSFKNKTITSMKIEDALGQITTIDFKKLKHHNGVDESRFKLVLPEDVDLIVEGE